MLPPLLFPWPGGAPSHFFHSRIATDQENRNEWKKPSITWLQVKTNLTTSAEFPKTILFDRKIFEKTAQKRMHLIKLAQKSATHNAAKKTAHLCGINAQLATLLHNTVLIIDIAVVSDKRWAMYWTWIGLDSDNDEFWSFWNGSGAWIFHKYRIRSGFGLCGGQKITPHVNKWSPLDGAHE